MNNRKVSVIDGLCVASIPLSLGDNEMGALRRNKSTIMSFT